MADTSISVAAKQKQAYLDAERSIEAMIGSLGSLSVSERKLVLLALPQRLSASFPSDVPDVSGHIVLKASETNPDEGWTPIQATRMGYWG